MPIKITCKDKDGFRRCGVLFPKGVTEYPDGKFRDKEIDLLKGEKHLAVEITTAKEESPSDDKKKKG